MRAAEPPDDRRFPNSQELYPSRVIGGNDQPAPLDLDRARMRGQLGPDDLRPTLEQGGGTGRVAGLGKPPAQGLSQPFHSVVPPYHGVSEPSRTVIRSVGPIS